MQLELFNFHTVQCGFVAATWNPPGHVRNTAVGPTLHDSSLTNLDFRHAAAVEDVCQRGLRHPLRGLRVEDLRCFLLMRVRLPIYNGFKLLLWI